MEHIPWLRSVNIHQQPHPSSWYIHSEGFVLNLVGGTRHGLLEGTNANLRDVANFR